MQIFNTHQQFLFLYLILLFLYNTFLCAEQFENEDKRQIETQIKNEDDDKLTGQDALVAGELVPNVENSLTIPNRRCQCGRTTISEMQQIMMINFEDKTTIKLFCLLNDRDPPLGKGTFSKVFHAELTEIGGQPYNKCVALKMTVKNEDDIGWQMHINEWKIQRAFDTLEENGQKSRVIKLIAYGYHKKDGAPVVFSVLELGQQNLAEYMKQEREECAENNCQLGDEQMEPFIRQIAETVRYMHQRIMHLDLKPHNLLYVQEEEEEQSLVLKAIDFGTSEFIGEDDEEDFEEQLEHERINNNISSKKWANLCKWFPINNPLTTQYYQSPEHQRQCNWKYNPNKEHSMLLSSKSDNWAIGIIAYEWAYYGLRFGPKSNAFHHRVCAKTTQMEDHKKNHLSFVIWISKIYLHKNEDELKETMLKHWEELCDIFIKILCIRFQFPRLFHLINAILIHDPKKRPTASDILDYLDGKCCIISAPGTMLPMLFPWLSMEAFKELVSEMLIRFNGKPKKWKRVLQLLASAELLPTVTPTNNVLNEQKPRKLLDIEKAISLSMSLYLIVKNKNGIMREDKKLKKYESILSNLQYSFCSRHFEISRDFFGRFVYTLPKIGYTALVNQLNVVCERNKNDAEMLKMVMHSAQEQVDNEWADFVGKMPSKNDKAAWDPETRRCWYIRDNLMEQLEAVQMYELMYKQLLQQNFDGNNKNNSIEINGTKTNNNGINSVNNGTKTDIIDTKMVGSRRDKQGIPVKHYGINKNNNGMNAQNNVSKLDKNGTETNNAGKDDNGLKAFSIRSKTTERANFMSEWLRAIGDRLANKRSNLKKRFLAQLKKHMEELEKKEHQLAKEAAYAYLEPHKDQENTMGNNEAVFELKNNYQQAQITIKENKIKELRNCMNLFKELEQKIGQNK